MKITFLGTGTSQGIPVIGCKCKVCQSVNPRDKRLRSSVFIESHQQYIVIDTGPDFRQQMLTNNISKLDAVLFTHEHKDHTAGLDDVRSFNFLQQKPMDVYAEKRVQTTIKREYEYVFADSPYPGIPQINMHTIENKMFNIGGLQITPIRLMHHKLPILGFRIGDFAYLTDVKTIPESEFSKLQSLKVLVITALRTQDHISHMSVSEAVKTIDILKPQKAYFTHISHALGLHNDMDPTLPQNVQLAYDNLIIKI